MAYNADVTWADVVGNLAYYGNSLKSAILAGHEQYQEWLMLRDGRTNAQMATFLEVSEQAIIDAEYAFGALEEMYMAATNIAVIQADRLNAIRRFT